MSQFKRMFVMLGPQMRYSPALQRAAALAESSGALLDVNVFVDDVDTFGLMSDGSERERLLTHNRLWLADVAEQLRNTGLDVSTELLLTRDPWAVCWNKSNAWAAICWSRMCNTSRCSSGYW